LRKSSQVRTVQPAGRQAWRQTQPHKWKTRSRFGERGRQQDGAGAGLTWQMASPGSRTPTVRRCLALPVK